MAGDEGSWWGCVCHLFQLGIKDIIAGRIIIQNGKAITLKSKKSVQQDVEAETEDEEQVLELEDNQLGVSGNVISRLGGQIQKNIAFILSKKIYQNALANEQIENAKCLLHPNRTRWHSWFFSVDSFLMSKLPNYCCRLGNRPFRIVRHDL